MTHQPGNLLLYPSSVVLCLKCHREDLAFCARGIVGSIVLVSSQLLSSLSSSLEEAQLQREKSQAFLREEPAMGNSRRYTQQSG